jgi:lipopolysaccharide/colanic/teichoic acid biosynthesis glycosyltransferase
MKRSKRLFDLFWATAGLLLLWPLLVLIALWIKLDDRGPVLFRQQRVGRRGELFHILKFRTMTPAAEERGKLLTIGQRDPRVTPAGYWLRRFKLDELPQLFNVLVGDMTLVGPRPEVPRYVALYTADQRRVLELVPGITDLASIKYRHESEILASVPDPESTYVHDIMPDKIRINLEYAARATFWSDSAIILRTLFSAIS